MRTYPYLRAYMAGVMVPTMVVPLLVLLIWIYGSFYTTTPHLERLMVFPLALVPPAWGIWNMLYLGVRNRANVGLGIFGMCFVFVWMPLAYGLQRAVGIMVWTPGVFAIGLPIAMLLYYLVWKHVVGFLNGLLGID